MVKSYKNREMVSENAEAEVPQLSFFFPKYSVTIKAASREEAEEKLKALVSKQK